MTQVFNLPIARVFENDGTVGAGYQLFFYETGTTTKKDIYSDEALTTPLTNPVVADANGQFVQIFLEGTGADYKAVLGDDTETDPPASPLWTCDPVDTYSFDVNSFDPRPFQHWGTTGGSATVYTLTPTDAITSYENTMIFSMQPHIDNTGTATIAVSGLTALDIKKYDNTSAKVDIEAGDLQASQTYIIRLDGTDAVVLNPGIPYIRLDNTTVYSSSLDTSFLTKRILCSLGTDTDHDISFGEGNFSFDDYSDSVYFPGIIKQIDATWAVGTNKGGLDTGTVANTTWYYLFAIYDPTTKTVDALFSASPTAPTMPSGYTKKKLVGIVRTDGSANILSFTQLNNLFNFTNPYAIFDGGVSAGVTTVTSILPVLLVEANVGVYLEVAGAGGTSLTVWGSLTTVSTQLHGVSITTNNAFITSGNGIIYSTNGSVSYQNIVGAGGVTNQKGYVQSIRISNL